MRRPVLAGVTAALLACVLALGSTGIASAGTWPPGTHNISLEVGRLAGSDRYSTAVAVARAARPGWSDVRHVVIASGETRAHSDALVAGSLCWAYDAPLLLVTRDTVPKAVRAALAEMCAANGGVDVTVVGGPQSVSAKAVEQIAALVAPGKVEQPWTVGDRYSTAAMVALRVADVAEETSRTLPARALIANGTAASGYADALSLSAVSARTGVPILLVGPTTLPPETKAALAALPRGEVIAAGGTASVSGKVFSSAGATARWAGADRYATSVAVAEGARARGWLAGDAVGIAASVPDALSGSVYMAGLDGPLLVTRADSLPPATAGYLARMRGVVRSATVLGGKAAVSTQQENELSGRPTVPVIVTPSPGSLTAKKARLKVRVGVNTTTVQVYAGSKRLCSKPAKSYSTVDFGTVSLPAEGTPLRIVAISGDGARSESSARYRRLTYPASTSIVVDKSDFALYFVKNDVLARRYPVAIGRSGMETPVRLWKIGAKYYTDPSSVYGPRKMRLYAKSGSSWVYTRYAIHGTNQPWVIGTKASHGCIRMRNQDVLELFPQVSLGTLVLIRE